MDEDRLREMLEVAKCHILEMEMTLARLMSSPLLYATVARAQNEFNLDVYEQNDMMLVIDRRHKYKKKYGHIVKVNKKTGVATLAFPDGHVEDFTIGMNNDPVQVKLLGKDDGTNVVVVVDGKLFEVHGVPGKKFKESDMVKVDMESKQVHDHAPVGGAGGICTIAKVLDDLHVEVEIEGRYRMVISGVPGQKLESGDRVVLDPSDTMIVRRLDRDGADRFNLEEEVNVTWDDIAGLHDAKRELVEAIELPHKFPDIFAHYGKRPPKGVCLSGPPGCGKTLCGKAVANTLAKLHKKEKAKGAFRYVKGPELLSMWVGNSEAQIRELFMTAREFHKTHGFPQVLFIDEADAIVPMRGSGKSSDVEKTIVPAFLAEMDGLETAHAIVLLATNQPHLLDPAVQREGRCDRHVRIGRPLRDNIHEYFKVHMRNVPLKDCNTKEVVAMTTAEIFAGHRALYRIMEMNGGGVSVNEHLVTLGDCASGAMIAGIVDHAKSMAVHRDIKSGKPSGVRMEDFQHAVERVYHSRLLMNGTFDVEDYIEAKGLPRCSCKVEKLKPSAA
jgi:proteasome-associated ATPase